MYLIQSFNIFAKLGDSCSLVTRQFLLFPSWYQYLPGIEDRPGSCVPQITAISDVWLIVAAIIVILLRIAGLAAVLMVVYGGASYITSQGEAEKVIRAKNTIINALVGLTIAIMASFIIAFIAGKIN